MTEELRAPKASNRTVVLGATGSGKTVFSTYLLSSQNFHVMPWVICDVKMDPFVLELCEHFRVPDLDLDGKLPVKAGLYHLPYRPKEIDELDAYLWRIDQRARDKGKGTGIYLDEGYSVNQSNKGAMATILTQGRTLKMPIIANFQRPSWMNQHFIAQADFFSVFPLTKVEDKKKAAETISPAKQPDGTEITPFSELPQYHSLWHDVGRRKTVVLRPAPTESRIIDIFGSRLGREKRAYI